MGFALPAIELKWVCQTGSGYVMVMVDSKWRYKEWNYFQTKVPVKIVILNEFFRYGASMATVVFW
jgi:hypothetical protein